MRINILRKFDAWLEQKLDVYLCEPISDDESWDECEKRLKEKYPGFRFWNWIDNMWSPFYRRFNDVYYWFLYRLIPRHKYHQIRPRTLKPGYHEQFERLLHGAFEMLVQYVEEAVHLHGDRPTPDKIDSKDALINSLGCLNLAPDCDYMAMIVDEESKKGNDSVPFEKFCEIDQEIVHLYWWWTRERIPPEQAWDHTNYPPPEKCPEDICSAWKDEEYPEFRKYMDDSWSLEEELIAKDQEMLERLVKIYRCLSV